MSLLRTRCFCRGVGLGLTQRDPVPRQRLLSMAIPQRWGSCGAALGCALQPGTPNASVALSCLCNPPFHLLSPSGTPTRDQGRTPRMCCCFQPPAQLGAPVQDSGSSVAATPHILGKNGSILACSLCLCCSGQMDEVTTFFYSPLLCVPVFGRQS